MSDTAALLYEFQKQLRWCLLLYHVVAGMQELTAVFSFISKYVFEW